MRIGELAQRSDCDVETVRFYEREGLLDLPAREANGYRLYNEAHLVQLKFVRHCRSLGMGLPDVRILRSFQANPDLACEEINQLIDRQIERIHQQLDSLHLLERQLHKLRDTCHANRKAGQCGIMRNLAQAAEGGDCSCHPPAGTN
ncbi:MAG: Cd(II)/Pb(II)-responsive transcriptional regulator [Candidatus Accumulibacter sp.]|jgi:Cd(II)/Pb(II)-responsive transcriptional regulator|uniref:Cd(II)/Pb(II)-responsive transcriptional regulator n=1 Tax=Accumulibacter sp. TaxID=2053492 RepID=UPI002587CB30|nr:Cd(II)/Pb(II)-responsive transcriptional regulator [Accumulibacter sp.]MBK8116674.1 Cd(II)/Pb(II)-responsive transcriptional regulator [Accumulibacter sp.]